ncbi:hypothetical protein [Cyclobacterium xiamenense]|nr:hypothetical protein [Cyclobacterium xiamenense]
MKNLIGPKDDKAFNSLNQNVHNSLRGGGGQSTQPVQFREGFTYVTTLK